MPISSADRRRRARGIATLEVLVAVAVVMLVGSVALLSLGGTDRLRLRQEAAEVSLFLQQARVRASESRASVTIRYSPDDRTLSDGRRQHRLPDAIEGPEQPLAIRIHPSGENDGLDFEMVRGNSRAAVRLDWLTGRIRADL